MNLEKEEKTKRECEFLKGLAQNPPLPSRPERKSLLPRILEKLKRFILWLTFVAVIWIITWMVFKFLGKLPDWLQIILCYTVSLLASALNGLFVVVMLDRIVSDLADVDHSRITKEPILGWTIGLIVTALTFYIVFIRYMSKVLPLPCQTFRYFRSISSRFCISSGRGASNLTISPVVGCLNSMVEA